ncbi:hypothetical protein KOW79_011196 [Hemibagrus wyckioides]|uniref:Clarin-3 n=1 Tax=Hemibagrus wyckioides TaxID=337641 RepID=A0A9D3NMK2_9TELE|nr:clarin-3 [Hemibagrus wyckioides]KAG7324880.1 hypothetical protein KOW79_011196 [Hemibagrus wyckioides]
MPSTEKILYFLSSALLTIIGVAVLSYGMTAEWSFSTMACSPVGSKFFNGSATIFMGLFKGRESHVSCPRFTSENDVVVYERLGEIGGAGETLHVLVVVLLVFALLASAGSILITLYNTISNPYETYMGPIGLYVCSGLSACLAFLAMALYFINLVAVNVPKDMLIANIKQSVILKDPDVRFLTGFFMIVPYIIVDLFAIFLVYLYAHMAYRQRMEQQRPTEDAPKEILMY